MKICPHIIHHINIEPDRIMPCCHDVFSNVPHSKITASGNIEKYITTLQSCLETYHNVCIGCANRETYEVTHKNIRDMMDISWILLDHHRNYCNCKCIYCGLWQNQVRPSPIRPLLDEVLSSGFVNKNAFVMWGGGESTLLPEFEETSAMLLSKELRQLVLTNGILYSPAIETMLREDMGRIIISLDCGTEETYRAVKGVNGFNRVCGTLKKYVSSARNVQNIGLKYILFDQNNTQLEIDQFFDLCAKLGDVSVSSTFESNDIIGKRISKKTRDAEIYFRYKANKNKHKYYDFNHALYPGTTDADIQSICTGPVYYWGCGDYYGRCKHLFAHCSPKYILLDKNPGNIATIDGIAVRHPAEVLPRGERLPIVIFAWDPIPILRTIATHYPWYRQTGLHVCRADDEKTPAVYSPAHRSMI